MGGGERGLPTEPSMSSIHSLARPPPKKEVPPPDTLLPGAVRCTPFLLGWLLAAPCSSSRWSFAYEDHISSISTTAVPTKNAAPRR